MKFAKGNEKLGSNCLVVSRPVGDTCPSSCEFLDNGCYAQKTEVRFPNAREAGFTNLHTKWRAIRATIMTAIKQGKHIRFHERGDFGINDEVDVEYVDNIAFACETILQQGIALPVMWSYTHFYDRFLFEKLSPFMSLYASVHNRRDYRLARKAGFRLFAYCDTRSKFPSRGKMGNPDAPKVATIYGETFHTCPEMRRGRHDQGVTCTGNAGTVTCDLCVKGLGNVLFLQH